MTELPQFPELLAPAAWRRIDFLSDLHLSPETPATLAALESHLQETAADAVILLGDIFEVWVGDDGRFDGFEAQVLRLLQTASQRLQLFFMAGNRDFLLGAEMLADAGMQGLADPTVLIAFGERWLLSHGDALCLSDQAYQAFRKQVRNPAWQAQFLAQPLDARRSIARQMRDGSKAQQAEVSAYADLDAAACVAWLRASGCKTLIHGHTHRPAVHELGVPGLRRQVLSDWDLEAARPRADLLRLRQAGLRRIQLA
ncbi:UDP-2,3-diacylglucosamine diphosphatase [Paucibacter sp. KBW04]|uniref:UDP-2,3-diacylglucosamine diphosphatase n=1 Tax=Paucibacter sp. KBW04 TaxID=2153361 RepID=UPI001E31CE6B|nr:UDP-2,3-diacylglucosamine diphosphatase [Paucibacter sp. KBW04]